MVLISCPIPGETFFTEFECLDHTSAGMELSLVLGLSYFLQDALSVRYIFGPGKYAYQTWFHHSITGACCITSLFVGRVVGVFTQNTMIVEISTFFVNNRLMMLELNLSTEKEWVEKYKANGISLCVSFFVARVVYLGIILGKYLLPVFIEYDYE